VAQKALRRDRSERTSNSDNCRSKFDDAVAECRSLFKAVCEVVRNVVSGQRCFGTGPGSRAVEHGVPQRWLYACSVTSTCARPKAQAMFECVYDHKHLIRACGVRLHMSYCGFIRCLSVVTVTARSLITKPTTRIWKTSFANQHDLYVESDTVRSISCI